MLRDPWPGAEPIPLIGWAERERFHPLLLAFLGGLATWFTFQAVATVATAVFLLKEITEAGIDQFAVVLAQHPDALFGANAVGQLVGLLMLTILLARLHTPDVFGYLRIRGTDAIFLIFSGAALLALMPFVSFVGELAQQLPFPDWMRNWDQQQQAFLEQILTAQVNVVLALLFVALTPAICEEVLFRGYLQRNVERSIGPMWAIVVVGFAFGLFHLRFAELIPLTLLGIYLCYIVWVSGSLWTGVLVHLMNNGIAVLVSQWAQTRPEPVVLDEITVPPYLALAGLAVGIGLCYAMLQRRRAVLPPSPDRYDS